MKVGGRIIQNKNILVNTEIMFIGKYKKHRIEVLKRVSFKTDENPEWSIDVYGFDGSVSVQDIVQRCCIHDAIVFALDGALL